MGTFIAAYALVWLAMALYVARLRSRQRELERRFVSLSPQEHHSPGWDERGWDERGAEAA
jgi:CcmD family protein